MRVDVGGAADAVFGRFLAASLASVARATYSGRGKYRLTRQVVGSEPRPRRRPPGEGWELLRTQRNRTVAVSGGDAPVPATPDDWHRVAEFSRRVTVTRYLARTWTNGNRTRVKRHNWTSVYDVAVAVDSQPSHVDGVPHREIRTLHERGRGALDGPNLAGVHGRVRSELVGGPGREELARQAALGTLSTAPRRVHGDRPDGFREHVLPDLMELRQRIRNVSTAVPRGGVGTGEVNAAGELAAELRARRASLVDAPPSYDSVAQKATVAARAAYVDAVIERLRERAETTERRNEGLGQVLSKYDLSLSDLQQAMEGDPSMPRGGRPMLADGMAGPVNVTVAGAPPYLTRAAVTHDHARAVTPGTELRPLRTKNVNVFTMPAEEAVHAVARAVSNETASTASLRTAALTLRAANRTLSRTANESLRHKRRILRAGLSMAVRRTRARLRTAVAVDDGLLGAASLTASEWNESVDAALARWRTTDERALAIANRSLATAVAAEAASRGALDESTAAVLELRLRATLKQAAADTAIRPPKSLVNDTGQVTRRLAMATARQYSKKALEGSYRQLRKRFDDRAKLTPAGLPLAPVPGYYYAVANLWINDIRGTYAAFTVSAPAGAPGGPSTVTYRRDGGRVEMDVDGDRDAELLGWSTRLSFEVVVPVVVVVPPNPEGLGDRNGNADERSDGWNTDPPLRKNVTAG